MAASANGTLNIPIIGLGGGNGSLDINVPVVSAAAIGQISSVILASGTNTITVPVGTLFVVIAPNNGNTVVLTLKGVAGDTGIAISKVNPTMLAFDVTAPANFVITAASLLSTATLIYFV